MVGNDKIPGTYNCFRAPPILMCILHTAKLIYFRKMYAIPVQNACIKKYRNCNGGMFLFAKPNLPIGVANFTLNQK